MSSDLKTIAFIVGQAGSAMTSRPMFGEHALYLDDRLVALVCDNKLFVKPTVAGRAHASDTVEAPPYPGAKPCLVIDAERWNDQAWLAALFRRTADELPLPKPRTTKIARRDSDSAS